MKKLVFGIVAAGLATAALTPLAGASSAPACATNNLKVSFNLIPNSQGAGNLEYTLKVANTGPNGCSLGKPTVTLIGKTGSTLPSHSISSGAAVVVPAGGTAKTDARFSPDVAGTGDKQMGQCEPTAYKLKIAFKGSTGTVTGAIKPPTPVCERGTMSLQPLKA
jgi:hypothetical protein